MIKYSSNVDFEVKLKNAINLISENVLATFGPFGRNILISKDGNTFLTKDGVTVAKSVISDDPIENACLDIIKQTADKTVKDVGDGPQPLYSKILTPNGFVEMGSLKIGDKICGTNNSIQEIIGIYPKGMKRIYKMKFSNNRVVECCLDHLWDVTTCWGKKKTVTTKYLLESKIRKEISPTCFQYKYYTPITSVEFNSKKLILDPFLVGLLIGDGSLSSKGSIELSLSIYQEYILKKLILPENIKFTYFKDFKKNYLRVKFSKKDRIGPSMHDYIKNIGLLGIKSKDKFIPKEYLYSSYQDRMALLEGLTESDGYINNRNRIEYSTISPQLCNDITELMRGLGKQVNVSLKTKRDSSFSKTPIYVIVELKGDKYGIKLKEIEETDQYTEMMCIQVSNDDNLYITNDYIVTHNTTTSILFIKQFVDIIKSTFQAFPNIPATTIKEEFDKQIKDICRGLEKISVPIKSKKTLKDVAFMASNGDNQIASIVSDLIDEVGSNGSISIKSSKTKETHMKIMEGMRFKSSVASNLFLSDLEDKKTMTNCRILVSNTKVCLNDVFMEFIQNCIIKKNSILIVCPEIEERALLLLLGNYERKLFDCAVIYPSYLGNEKLDVFEDIALITNTKTITSSVIPTSEIDVYGFCSSVDIFKYESCLVDAASDPAFIDATVTALRGKLQATEDDGLIRRLNARINRLSASLGVLYVGGATEAEIIEKKHRVEDAIESCHSALKKGVVMGGGNSLAYISSLLNLSKDKDHFVSYIQDRLTELCLSPSKLLYKTDIKQYNVNDDKFEVKDLRTNNFVDPFENGVIESVYTIQCSLINSFSAAFVLCNTYGAIKQ